MSNYMGGARNFAKRRNGRSMHRSSYPRLKAFSSRGFAMNRPLDRSKLENIHQFELSHAKNAYFPSKTREDVIQPVAHRRIDAVSPMSIQSYPSAVSKSQRDAWSANSEVLGGTDAETRHSKFSRILQRKDLLELAPRQSNTPLQHSDHPVRPKRPLTEKEEATPDRSFKKRKFNRSSATTSRDGSHSNDDSLHFVNNSYQSSLHSQIGISDFFPSDDVTAKPTSKTMEDLIAELEEHDEILSFPSTPSNKDPNDRQISLNVDEADEMDETAYDMYNSTYAFDDLSPEISEHEAESLFSMRDHSVISSRGFWGQLSPTWSPDQPALTPHDQELVSPGKLISNLMGYDHESSAVELDHSRLPNDRSGVGIPPERWICDNVEPERADALLESEFAYESDSEEASLIEHDWLHLPYETDVSLGHIAAAVSTPDNTSSSWSNLHFHDDVSCNKGSAEKPSPVDKEGPPIERLKVNADSFVEDLPDRDINELESRALATKYSAQEIPVTKTQMEEGSQMREGENMTFVLAPDLFG